MTDQPASAAPTTIKNETTADEQQELRRLFVSQLIDGLKSPTCKASFLAVVQRFLSETKETPTVPANPLADLVREHGGTARTGGDHKLPFPTKKTGDDGRPWEKIEAQPYDIPTFNAPKFT